MIRDAESLHATDSMWLRIKVVALLNGSLVSASSATVYAYLGELHTAARRASAIAWGSAFISFSFMILPGLAWLIIPGAWSWNVVGFELVPWRVFVLCWCLPGLMAAALLLILPESPKFIIALRGPQEALPVLARMNQEEYTTLAQTTVEIRKAADELFRLSEMDVKACTKQRKRRTKEKQKEHTFPTVKKLSENPSSETNFRAFSSALKNFGLLFRPPLLRCVVISHVSMFAVFMLSSGLYMWTPDILNNLLRNPDSRHLSICDVIRKNLEAAHNTSIDSGDNCTVQVSVALFPISMGMGAVFALTYLAIGFFINKIGKKTLYCEYNTNTAMCNRRWHMLCCGALTAAGGLTPSATAATVLLVLALCSGCAASILAAITVDVFPTSLRAMSMCVMYMVGRAGAAAGASALGRVLDTHCRLAFCVFGAITAGSTVLMLLWPKPQRIRQRMEKKGLTY
ncbi:Synaptic vesicle glycoprotein 2A [Eumeta japonica]|uniref:Synaptic vesicle glycoprotein 2A n=1 Tax=Eumeta variegata TaxID=151549 RepID=A0A4C1U5P0_EUMVA|nr:Synaptic vesicle glycoprotein 2A [Eumeta japonica]